MLINTLCVLAVIGFSVFNVFFYCGWLRDRRLQEPYPSHWKEILESRVPVYNRLPTRLKDQLEQHVQLFLAENSFYGCDGFEIGDQVRVTIAGHACLLIVARSFSDFDEISSIPVYPNARKVR